MPPSCSQVSSMQPSKPGTEQWVRPEAVCGLHVYSSQRPSEERHSRGETEARKGGGMAALGLELWLDPTYCPNHPAALPPGLGDSRCCERMGWGWCITLHDNRDFHRGVIIGWLSSLGLSKKSRVWTEGLGTFLILCPPQEEQPDAFLRQEGDSDVPPGHSQPRLKSQRSRLAQPAAPGSSPESGLWRVSPQVISLAGKMGLSAVEEQLVKNFIPENCRVGETEVRPEQ